MKRAKITLKNNCILTVRYTSFYKCMNDTTTRSEHYMSFMIKTENACHESLLLNPHDILKFEPF